MCNDVRATVVEWRLWRQQPVVKHWIICKWIRMSNTIFYIMLCIQILNTRRELEWADRTAEKQISLTNTPFPNTQPPLHKVCVRIWVCTHTELWFISHLCSWKTSAFATAVIVLYTILNDCLGWLDRQTLYSYCFAHSIESWTWRRSSGILVDNYTCSRMAIY